MDEELGEPPFAHVSLEERAALARAVAAAPRLAEFVDGAPDYVDDPEGLVQVLAQSLVNAACDMSPFGPWYVPPIVVDVALLADAVQGSIESHEAPVVAEVAAAICAVLPTLADAHVDGAAPLVPDEDEGLYDWANADESDLGAITLRVHAVAVSAEHRFDDLERQVEEAGGTLEEGDEQSELVEYWFDRLTAAIEQEGGDDKARRLVEGEVLRLTGETELQAALWLALADACSRAELHDRALVHAQRAWDLTTADSPDRPFRLALLGAIQLDAVDLDTALASFEQAVTEHPDSIEAHEVAVDALRERDHEELAMQWLDRTIAAAKRLDRPGTVQRLTRLREFLIEGDGDPDADLDALDDED